MIAKRTVVVVDDDPAVCESVCELIATDDTNCVAFSTGNELLEAVDTLQPACVALDITLGTEDGFDIFHQLKLRSPSTPVILVTADGSIAARKRAMELGAIGFFEKPYEPAGLRKTIIAAVNIGSERRQHASFQSRFSMLPEQDQALLLLMLSGSTNAEVAGRLALSEDQLITKLQSVLSTLGLSNLSEARERMALN